MFTFFWFFAFIVAILSIAIIPFIKESIEKTKVKKQNATSKEIIVEKQNATSKETIVEKMANGWKRVIEKTEQGTQTFEYDEKGRKRYYSVITKFGNFIDKTFDYDD
jgi:hypothetical protein